MNSLSDLSNRIKKNFHRLRGWAKAEGYEAFRVYDRDIPEYPYTVDVYGMYAVAWAHLRPDKAPPPEQALKAALASALGIAEERCILKVRQQMAGKSQYNRLSESQRFFPIKEGEFLFRVNLEDYLDTGLFLDTRLIRQKIIPSVQDPGQRFLNLFAYTGTLSVVAAKRGFQTVTCDMSATYLAWARENFSLNALDPKKHEFIQADVMQFLAGGGVGTFDWIYLDPPTFSNSKRMQGTFDVRRDHEELIGSTMRLLKPHGTLIFVTNHQSFKLSPSIQAAFQVEEISTRTIPRDCERRRPHRSYIIRISP